MIYYLFFIFVEYLLSRYYKCWVDIELYIEDVRLVLFFFYGVMMKIIVTIGGGIN